MAEILPIAEPPADKPLAPADRLLVDIRGLAALTSISTRQLRRLDAAGDVPGRVTLGRRVLFRMDVIKQWIANGLPDAKTWEAMQRAAARR